MTTDHIVIGDLRPRVQYVADGTVRDFAYPFPIFKAADLEVWLGEVRATAGFTTTGAGSDGGGTVSFGAAPVAGTLVTLRRRLAVQRVSDFQEGGAFRAKVVNDELDYQTAVLQQLEVDLSRALRLAPTDPSTASLVLPPPQPGKAIGWNADASGLTNDPADFAQARADVQATLTAAQAAAAQAAASAQQAAAATEAILIPTVDAQEAALMAQAARDAAQAAGAAAATDAAAADASATAVAGEAAATGQWTAEAQTLVWLAERNAAAVGDAVTAAQGARAEALGAAETTLLDRIAAERAADRATLAAATAAAALIGTRPGQALPGWARIDT